MCKCLCSVIVLYGMMMKGREKVKPGAAAHSLLFSKSTEGAPGLTSPPDGRIAIKSIICLLNIHTAEGFGILSRRTVMYNLAIRKCTSPSHIVPRLKIFKLKFTTPPGIEPRTC